MQLVLDLLVPGIIAGVSCYGMAKRVDVYDALLQGAAKGLEILLRILPALVTLLTVVAMLRASGALELAAELLAPALEWLGIPPETVGLMLVRPISGSAALGVGSELITTYGPDSTIGRTAAVMLGSTETTFYTIAVYFGAAGIDRGSWPAFSSFPVHGCRRGFQKKPASFSSSLPASALPPGGRRHRTGSIYRSRNSTPHSEGTAPSDSSM